MAKKEYLWVDYTGCKKGGYYIKFTAMNNNPYEVDLREILLCIAEQMEELNG